MILVVSRRDRAVRDQIAYDKAQRKRSVLENKIVADIARRIVAIIQSKYDYRLVVNCEESALIALYRDGVLPPIKVPRQIKKGRKRLFVAAALDSLIQQQIVTVAFGSSGEFVLQTERPAVVPTQKQEGFDCYDEHEERVLSPRIREQLKAWAA